MWSRPAGEPRVWRIIELIDLHGKKRKFSLQEIPNDRYEEALDFFCTIFLRDEAMCASLDLMHDPESVALFRKLWVLVLNQGISVAAYEIFDDNTKPILAALNMLVYVDDVTDEVMKSFVGGSTKADKVLDFVVEASHDVDPRKTHNTDRYLTAFGLGTYPEYRRLGLGRQLLEIRDGVGEAYNIEYTSTAFTGPASQKAAKSAGFETILERCYDEAVDKDGNLIFKSLKGCFMKVMEKKIKN